MEFRFRASQQRQRPLFLPLHPLPPLQSMHVSYIPVGGLMAGRQSLQELERELHEETIKEEIIARRIVQKRMLEEEARLDMVVEHGLMMMERYQAERCPIPLAIMPPQHQLGSHLISELEFDQQKPFRGSPVVEVVENLPLVPSISDVETDSEVNLLDWKLARTKRKADATVSRPKDWSCALCRVTMTSEDDLNGHLKGKKHKANAAQLGSSKKSAAPSMVKNTSKAVAMAQEKKGPRGGRTVRIQVNGKIHQVLEKGRFIWCLLCKVKCNGKEMMAHHLKGKKHLAKEASRNGEKSEVDN